MTIQTILTLFVTGAFGAFIYGFIKNKKEKEISSEQTKIDQNDGKIEVISTQIAGEEAVQKELIKEINTPKKDVAHEELVSFFNDYINSQSK